VIIEFVINEVSEGWFLKFCTSSVHALNISKVEQGNLCLLVASFSRGETAVPLMQCPYHQYTGTHFADLRRMISSVNPTRC